MSKSRASIVGLAALMIAGGGLWCQLSLTNADAQQQKKLTSEKPSDEAAVNRTRKQLRMLDDLYKTAVVFITDKYVNDEDDFPAGSAAVALFGAMKQKGWHDVRLLDATGQPIEANNSPQDEFEKEAVKQLLSGQNYYEKIINKDGRPYLRGATPIPVVLKKCIMCHPHYADAKEGAAIGALSYTLVIE